MDQKIWSQLPEELINRICCEEVKSRGTHPFAEEIKTLFVFDDIISNYIDFYGSLEDAYAWLSIDLDDQYPVLCVDTSGWGIHRKWNSLTPVQRREFFSVFI